MPHMQSDGGYMYISGCTLQKTSCIHRQTPVSAQNSQKNMQILKRQHNKQKGNSKKAKRVGKKEIFPFFLGMVCTYVCMGTSGGFWMLWIDL
jgi:hypothetical protein